MQQQQALETAFGAIVLGPRLSSAEELARVCRDSGVEPEDASELGAQFERLLVYRELVRGTLLEALELAMPRTLRRLGPIFLEYFDRFLLERAPRTHYLRDLTPELLSWCEALWACDPRLPAYAHELARHESLQIEISALPAATAPRQPRALELTSPVELCEALRLVEYAHAVHELPSDPSDVSVPERRPVSLLVYRSPEHEVRYLDATPLARAIVARLLQKLPLGEALRLAANDAEVALDETVVSGCAKLLAELAERGIVLGPACAGGPEAGAR